MVIAGAINSSNIWLSTDSGTNWLPIGNNGHIHWSLKGGIKQIQVKGDEANQSVYILINFEE
jgi:hypothetical protein